MHIIDWSARRSGPSMTVHGTAEIDGHRVKLAGIKKIEVRTSPAGGMVYAIDSSGDEHILHVS